MGIWPACMSVYKCMPGAHRSQEKTLGLRELGSQKGMSCHVSAGNQLIPLGEQPVLFALFCLFVLLVFFLTF